MADTAGRESWVEMGGCGMVDPNVFDAVGPLFTARECTLPDGYIIQKVAWIDL